jgi:hypothetical protein
MFATAVAAVGIYAEDGICHRCEVIREQNKTQHHNYEYYEDYLESEGKGLQTSNAPAVKNTPSHATSNTQTTPNSAKKSANNRRNSANRNNSNNNTNNDQNNNSQNNNKN